MSDMSWEDEIIKSRINLQKTHPFFWYIAMHLQLVEVPEMSSPWATDGTNLYYCPKKLEDGEWRQYVSVGLLHEAWHCAALHCTPERTGNRLISLWRIAVDIETNYLLHEAGLVFPPNFPGIPGAPGAAEQHYEKLLKKTEEQIESLLKKAWDNLIQGQKGQGQGQGQSSSDSQDDKDSTGDSISTDTPRPMTQEEKDLSAIADAIAKRLGLDFPGSDGHSGRPGRPPGDGSNENTPRQSPIAPPVDWPKVVSQAKVYAESQQGHGTLPGGMEEIIDRLTHPLADWRQAISRFFASMHNKKFTFEKPNRRFVHRGIYLPGPKKLPSTIVLALDTSGSMSSPQIAQCLTEMWGIGHQYSNLDLIILVIDTQTNYVCKRPEEVRVLGRGGTDFRPAFDYIEEHHLKLAGLIYFTDGYGSYPENAPTYPVIWAMVNDYKPPFGNVVRIPIKER